MNLTKSDAAFIEKELGNQYISEMDVASVLDKLDDLITYKGFDLNYDLNTFGREAQRVYGRIYYMN